MQQQLLEQHDCKVAFTSHSEQSDDQLGKLDKKALMREFSVMRLQYIGRDKCIGLKLHL